MAAKTKEKTFTQKEVEKIVDFFKTRAYEDGYNQGMKIVVDTISGEKTTTDKVAKLLDYQNFLRER